MQPNLRSPHQLFPFQNALLFRQTIPLPSPRTPDVPLTPFSSEKFYELKTTLATRAAGFGYGCKYDFTKELPQSPPPNTYRLTDGCSEKKGFAFGESRQNMVVTGPLLAIANAPKSRIRSQGKYSKKTKNRSAFQGRANTALLFPSAKTASTSMPNTKTAACQISAECWDVAKQQRTSCQGQPATMCPRTKLYRPRGGTACPARRTARPEVSGPRREEKSP